MDRPHFVRELFAEYRLIRLLRASPATLRKYQAALKFLDVVLGRAATLDDLTDANIAAVLDYCLSVRAVRSTSANSYRSKLVALWSFARNRGWVNCGPLIERLDEEESDPVAWKDFELVRLFAACQAAPGWLGGIPQSEWWMLFHSIIYYTGERPGAVLKLGSADFDPVARQIVSHARHRKGKRKIMILRLDAGTARLIADSLASSARDLILPFPYTYETFLAHYRKLLRSAGLPEDRGHMPQCLRRTHATWLEIGGGDATESLGHSSRQITKRYYLSARLIRRDAPADRLWRPTG
jgi:integrase